MKFLCDRCKTRYSIGDERVRGKILKIRCKNCANVITVREGMPDADAIEAAPRRNKTTTQAPASVHEAPTVPAPSNGGRGNALGAAFANAMSKPPPALEEEWYVSIDGEQAGPFSLAEAQRWVTAKPFDAELHCWSEGFDDWLPVDKVSHFRGLRKKPQAPGAPPPLPRLSSGPGRMTTAHAAAPPPQQAAPGYRAGAQPHAHVPAPIDESEPKPLFAATMASLEKSQPAIPASTRGLGLPPLANGPAPAPTAPARATPPAGYPSMPRTNGALARGPQPTSEPSKPALPAATRTSTAPGMGGAKKAFEFDASEAAPGESATVIEAQRFPTPTPIARPPANDLFSKRGDDDAGATTPDVSRAAVEATPSSGVPPEPEHDDLDIGEVSRVVKLADIARSAGTSSRRSGPLAPIGGTAQTGRGSGSIAKLGTSSPKLGGTASVPLIDAVDAVPSGAPSPIAHEPSAPVAAHVSHRRGLIALLVGAAILVGAAVVVVVLVLDKNEGSTGLGDKYDLDTERPDDIIVRRIDGSGNVEQPANPFVPRKYRPPTNTNPRIDNTPTPGGNALQAEEIELMANRANGLTARCFMRASKGTDGILLGDVKKVTVTLSIKPDGSVSDVGLSDNHANDTLGRCLIGFIRTWKFRESPGGTFRFVLARPEV